MKIAIIASPVTPLRPQQSGGAQAFVSDLATGLVRRGHHVHLHCAEGSEVPGVTLQPVEGGPVEAVALVAGRISPEKGIEHALQAARQAGIRVRVAGAAYDPGYVVDLTGAEQLGPLPRDELRRVMERSAVTIC